MPVSAPLTAYRWFHKCSLLCILAGNATAALVMSERTGNPLVDAKWLAVGIAGAALLVVWALGCSRETRRWVPLEFLGGLAVMALGIVLSALASEERGVSLHTLTAALVPLAWGAMILTTRWSGKDLAMLEGGLIGLAVLVAAIGLGQYYAPGVVEAILGFGAPTAQGRAAIISTIGNPEYLGGFLAPTAVLALGAAWRATRPPRAIGAARLAGECPSATRPLGARMPWTLYGTGFLIIVWALLLTEARGAWIGFGVGALVLWLCLKGSRAKSEAKCARAEDGKREERERDPGRHVGVSVGERGARWPTWILAAGAAAILVLVSLPTPLNPYRTSLLRRIGQAADLHSSSVRQRLLLYVVAADMIRAHGWVGAGPDTFSRRFGPALAAMRTPETEGAINRIAYQLGDLHPGFVHCDWLQFWVENGVLGAAGFLWLIASSAVPVWAAFRQTRKRARELDARNRPRGIETDPQFRTLCAGYAAAWFCAAVYSLFAFPFHSPDRVLLYWTLFGLMGASVGALIADEAGVAGKAGAESPITPQPPPVRRH